MTVDRTKWLLCWGYEDGTPEADAAWAEKQAFDARIASPSGLTIIPDITSFRSPVDGSVVGSRRALAEHNRRNDVVQTGNDRVAQQNNAPMTRAGYDIKRAMQNC